MSRKKSDKIAQDAYLKLLTTLLANGYTDDVRLFTNGIQTNTESVVSFEAVFDMLNDENLINWQGTSSQEASMERVENTLEEMRIFLEGISRKFKNYIIITNHGHDATFEIGWFDHAEEQVVWDRWIDEVDDAVIAFADVGFLFDVKEYHFAPKPTEKPNPPLYRYHPERFKAYRDYAESVGKFFRQKVEPASGMMTVEQLNEVMRIVINEINQRSIKFPRKFKESHPHPSLVIETEATLATAYGRFVQAGRQIMDFPPALIELLSKTDIDDIPLNSIKLPYTAQYLHFGPQVGLELESGWLVDGAYVEQRGDCGDVRFTITAIPSDNSLSGQWYLFPEPEYTQDFVDKYRTMNMATAIDTVLSEKLADLQVRQAKKGGDITATVQSEFSKTSELMPDDVKIIDVGQELAALRDNITRRRHPIYKESLQLIVNALCYVTAYPDDIDTVWPSETPDSLKANVLRDTGKKKMRAKSKLAALGYVPVHICGKRLAEQRVSLGIHPSEHGHIATHWRRGHWRNQVHGPARSLRKLIWVMPVIVSPKNHENAEAGHLYLVS